LSSWSRLRIASSLAPKRMTITLVA
jgi:hypothetical protein